ncbi:MAG TPA: hypothetical protein VMV50_02680 [Candidatus Paceibacterota bacterium]|nr:hypothetical protein [Candidatus Paceibacterota bacterium]
MKKTLTVLAVVLGILFAILALYYWMTPSGSLPAYLPGYEAGSSHVHFKHGLASLILAIALFIYAWFAGAPPKPQSAPLEHGNENGHEADA